jgi:hypothetical protein
VVTWNAKGRPRKKPAPTNGPVEPSNNAMLKAQKPGEAVAKVEALREDAVSAEEALAKIADMKRKFGM